MYSYLFLGSSYICFWVSFDAKRHFGFFNVELMGLSWGFTWDFDGRVPGSRGVGGGGGGVIRKRIGVKWMTEKQRHLGIVF